MNKEAKLVRVWITRYALTHGIQAVDAELIDGLNMIRYSVSGGCAQYAHGKDWHKTPAEAIVRAEEMRNAKISSLRKKISKMASMTFVVPE